MGAAAADGGSAAQVGAVARGGAAVWIVTVVVVVLVLGLIAAFVVFNSTVYYVGTAGAPIRWLLYRGCPTRSWGSISRRSSNSARSATARSAD